MLTFSKVHSCAINVLLLFCAPTVILGKILDKVSLACMLSPFNLNLEEKVVVSTLIPFLATFRCRFRSQFSKNGER